MERARQNRMNMIPPAATIAADLNIKYEGRPAVSGAFRRNARH